MESWFPNRAWSLAADGSMLIAPDRDAYRVEWLEPDGTPRRIIERDFQPHVRNDEERRRVKDRMRMWRGSQEIAPKKTICDTEPAIERIRVLDDGEIWVSSCYAERDLPEGVYRRYDAFDSEGRFEREVRVAWPVDRDRDYFALLNDGRFLWLRNMRSALDAVYANVESRSGDDPDEDLSNEDLTIQVVLLERAE